MYLKKEIIISFFIITISASNLYMTMIWFYVFLLDFLIPFLCDPDLQWILSLVSDIPDGDEKTANFFTVYIYEQIEG